MSGGWAGSDRRDRLPSDWPARRAKVLARDGYRCTEQTPQGRCVARATDVDHVVRGDDHSLANLTSLCSSHHAAKSAREGVEARQWARQQRKRPAPRDPFGLR